MMLILISNKLHFSYLARLDPSTARFLIIWIALGGALSIATPGNILQLSPSFALLATAFDSETLFGLIMLCYAMLEFFCWLSNSWKTKVFASSVGLVLWLILGLSLMIGGANVGQFSWGGFVFLSCAMSCAWAVVQNWHSY